MTLSLRHVLLPAALALTASASLALAQNSKDDHGHSHDHAHDHSHSHDGETMSRISEGYFEDSQVAERPLSDWEGEWQSVYPLLQSGALDPVMAHKAEHGEKSPAEYKAYYDIGYATQTDSITIKGDQVSFVSAGKTATGTYASDGYEILTYAKGNRGVRFIFKKTAGDAAAPAFMQFSDHIIAPQKADHYHLYWGDDRAALLQEVTNWPTYYPASLSEAQIVSEMLAH
ncbi:metal-binding protein ZinT [Xinfangfangia sp. D13-10-4-6]|uniref:ZinT family metal-binding protein n=1 Tax=Pseudogemmobacter hezensis TaxID=2737662 RepID=UPI001555993F|nr:metal-binding protein ZinT [Pseudogemmobacter hezensis]NPD15346.1 metal-binding protein ZinT [Pseudogemmobacter hezensis]